MGKRLLGAGILHEFTIRAETVNAPLRGGEHVLKLISPTGVIAVSRTMEDKPIVIDDLYSELFSYCEQKINGSK